MSLGITVLSLSSAVTAFYLKLNTYLEQIKVFILKIIHVFLNMLSDTARRGSTAGSAIFSRPRLRRRTRFAIREVESS